MLLKMAWRNIWRNRRRSLITMSSILFAVFFAVMMRSLQFGTYDRIIGTVVNSYSGYLQLHLRGYWADKVLDNAMPIGEIPSRLTRNVVGVVNVYPRTETFALAASDSKTRGVFVVGLDPDAEDSMLNLTLNTTSGHLFSSSDRSLMLGERLARNLNVVPGDTMVLLGQGFHGTTAAGKYPVSGLISFPSPRLGSNIVFLPFAESQELFGTYGLATSLVVQIREDHDVRTLRHEIEARVDTSQFEVMTWREMMPELVQTIQADSSGGIIMIGILYLVVSFGIFGTLLMMMNERRYEFGVLLAVGMNRFRLISVVLYETVMLSAGGILAGVALAMPLQYYFKLNPIRFSGRTAQIYENMGWEAVLACSTDPSISVTHAAGILLVTLIISLYAVHSLTRLRPVDAMRP